jgi:hypothetical protein
VLLAGRDDRSPGPPRREHDGKPGPGGSEDGDTDDGDDREIGGDFHDLLNAQALGLPAPLQIMRRETRDATIKASDRQCPLQNDATRAWNLHTAGRIYCPLPAFGPAALTAPIYPPA